MHSTTVIDCLSSLFCLLGFPCSIHSDCGVSFVSRETRSFLTARGISFSTSSPYHPQGNGQCERINQTIWRTIKFILHGKNLHEGQWESVLTEAFDRWSVSWPTKLFTNVSFISLVERWLEPLFLRGCFLQELYCCADLSEIKVNLKGSKDSDSSLVSNKNLSEILLLAVWVQGLVTWAENLSHFWCHSTKSPKPQIIFHCRIEDLPHLSEFA